MIRKLLIRLGLLRSTLALTALSMLILVFLTGAIGSLTGRKSSQLSLWIAFIVPAITALIYSVPFIRPPVRLDGTGSRWRELSRRDGLTGLYNRAYLIELVERLLECILRQTDVVARYGGDEFALLLSNTGEKSAQACIERICKTLARTSIPISILYSHLLDHCL